jgi:amino acid transporter
MVGRVPLATANDGLFPSVFGRLSRRDTPVAGMLIAGVLATTLIALKASDSLVELFEFIILLSTLGTLVPYLFCSLASLMIDPPGAGRLSRGAIAVAILAFVYAMVAVGGAGADVVYWGFLLLVAGLPVYVWVRRPGAPGVSDNRESPDHER